MKRALVLTALLAIAAVGGALAYRAAVRDRSYRVLIASGEAALAAGDTLAAVEDFSGAVAVRSDAMLARLRRGETYYRRGELDLAARDFRAASSLDPTATRPLEALADVLFAQGRYHRAVETYQQRLALDDRSAAVRYKLGLARYREGAVADALADARRAVALDPELATAHYLVALCLRDQGQSEQAVSALEEAVSRAPGLIAAREELADLLAASGRAPEQLEQLQVLAGLDSQHTERQVAVGLAQATAGKTDLAVATLSAALDRATDPAVVHVAIGRVWLQIADERKDRPDAVGKALEALERAASSLTATSETKALYGRALALSGQLEAAEQLFQQATQRYPLDPSALHQLGLVAEELKHYDIARSALIDYRALAGAEGDVHGDALRIGSLSLQLNDPSTATAWLDRALAITPDDGRALALLVEAQMAGGQLEAARATLDRVRLLDAKHPQLVALERKLKKASAATAAR